MDHNRALSGSSSDLPAGLWSGLSVWLDARAGLTLSGSNITAWASRVGGWTFNASVGSAWPVLVQSGLMPAARFEASLSSNLKTSVSLTTLNNKNLTYILVGAVTGHKTCFPLADLQSANAYGLGGLSRRFGYAETGTSKEGIINNRNSVFGFRVNSGVQSALYNQNIYSVSGTGPNNAAAFGIAMVGGMYPGNGSSIDLGLMLVWNRTLSDAEWQLAAAWAASQFQTLPDSTPTASIVWEGSSIARGNLGLGQTSASTAMANLGLTERDYWMQAVDGSTFTTMTSRAAATDALRNSSFAAKRNICVVWELINTLRAAGATPAAVQSAVQTYCQARQAAGWKVVVATCLPAPVLGGGNANFVADRNTVNAWIASNWATFADGLADVASDATIGVDGANTNGTYYNADQLHPKDAGHALAAPYFQTAINTILTS